MGAARRLWNAADHPRGPNGRFISKGPAGPSAQPRPSLTDAVLGTAAGGPKRQRRTARDLMRPAAVRPAETSPVEASRAKRTARSAFEAATVTGELRQAKSLRNARDALQGLNVAQLREVGASAGYRLPSKATKADLIDRLAEIAGRRLDSEAIARMR